MNRRRFLLGATALATVAASPLPASLRGGFGATAQAMTAPELGALQAAWLPQCLAALDDLMVFGSAVLRFEGVPAPELLRVTSLPLSLDTGMLRDLLDSADAD